MGVEIYPHNLNELKGKIMTINYVQYGKNLPSYANGLGLSNDATTPNNIIDIALGTCLDSTQTFQLSLPAAITINITLAGLNGLDTGSVAASTVYAIYLVADPFHNAATGAVFSTSLTGPTMPSGYGAYSLIGYCATDASKHILKAYWTAGNTGNRYMMFDAPQATAVTAGNATSYTAVDLTKWVPAVNNIPVWIASAFTPAAAGHAFKMQPVNGTGDAVIVNGQVTSVVVNSNSMVFAQIAGSKPEINYLVGNGSDAVAINVAGYEFFI